MSSELWKTRRGWFSCPHCNANRRRPLEEPCENCGVAGFTPAYSLDELMSELDREAELEPVKKEESP